MTVLPFSCVQSSTFWARGPPSASCLASEKSLRRDLSCVLASAFEPVAVVVLARLRGQETAEKCERRISAALSEAGCGIVRVVLEAGDPAAEQLVLDDRTYYCAGKQRSHVVTSFGLVDYECNRYRRRNCETVAPSDDRFGIPLGFWPPLAARHAALAMAMAMEPAKDCENMFRELGGTAPAATAPSGLIDPLGTVWEAQEPQALEAIRAEEEVVAKATAISVSADGVMLGMRKANGTPQQGDAPRPAGFREASSGTVSLHGGSPGEDGSLPRLRTVGFGRMPQAGKVSLKEVVAAEVRHLAQRRPDLPIVCIADGAPDTWSFFLHAFPSALQALGKACNSASQGGGRQRLWQRHAGNRQPLQSPAGHAARRAGGDPQRHPLPGAAGPHAPVPQAHPPRAEVLPKEPAADALCGNEAEGTAHRQRPRRGLQSGSGSAEDEMLRNSLVRARNRKSQPELSRLVEVGQVRRCMATDHARLGTRDIYFSDSKPPQHIETGELRGIAPYKICTHTEPRAAAGRGIRSGGDRPNETAFAFHRARA